MHRISYFAFLLFYVASTDAISGERVVMIVSGLQQSPPTGDRTRLDAGKQLPQGFPNYREAKPRGGAGLPFGRTKSVHTPPNLNERCIHPQTHPLKALFSLESVLLRAPPIVLKGQSTILSNEP